jgi:hypothetical protein
MDDGARREATAAMERFLEAVREVDGERLAALATPDSRATWAERVPGRLTPAAAFAETLRPVGPLLGRSVIEQVVIDGEVALVTLSHPVLSGRDTYTLRLIEGSWLLDLTTDPIEEPENETDEEQAGRLERLAAFLKDIGHQ